MKYHFFNILFFFEVEKTFHHSKLRIKMKIHALNRRMPDSRHIKGDKNLESKKKKKRSYPGVQHKYSPYLDLGPPIPL